MEEEEEVQQHKCEECKPGLPGWLATFADLMSLLLTFFVLLLSFADTRPKKFKEVQGSLRDAFGVQRKVYDSDMPKGTSHLKQQFSPGQPTLMDIKIVTQQLAIEKPEVGEPIRREEQEEETEEKKNEIQSSLENEIEKGLVEVERVGDKVIVRIPEKASFPSGSASIQESFVQSLIKITKSLKKTNPSALIVVGHTDNVPISSRQYRSNWDLSAARAVTVTHALIKAGKNEKKKIQIMGHADTKPLVPNDSAENRAKNRRVEILVSYEGPSEPTPELRQPASEDE